MRNLIPMIALFGACLFTVGVSATTIVPFANLGEATVNSEVVVLAHALSRVETLENGDIYQYTRFEVMENVKGGFAIGAQFLLRPMSHRSGDYDIDIAGDFSALLDKTYLLFLYKKGDVWMPMMLSYYVFEQFTIGSEQFLAPVNEQGIEVVHIPGQALPEPLAVYKSSELLQNLAKYVQNPRNWDGSPGRTQLLPQDLLPADRAVPVGCDFMLGNSANLARWQNAAIPIYYDDTAIPPNWNNTFSNIHANSYSFVLALLYMAIAATSLIQIIRIVYYRYATYLVNDFVMYLS